MHQQTVDTACLMSEVSLGHIDTRGTRRVCLHATLTGGHLGSFTHEHTARQTSHTACLMSEVSLGHIDTRGTRRVCLHATLTGGHLGSFTHDTPAWQTPYRHPTTGSATVVLTVGLKASRPALH